MTASVVGRRRRRGEAERRAALDRYQQSGQGVAAFCQAEAISPTTLQRWKAEFGGEPSMPGAAAIAAPGGFLDLGALGGGAMTIELDLGAGVTRRIRRG